MSVETNADDSAYVTALVREADRPRYYATLFAPAAARGDLFALYGFAAEIARVPDQVSDPTLGEIRLRWWQESLAEAVAGGGGGTPALRAIAGAMTRHKLPLAPFEAMIEARSANLYSDPPPTLADVEGRMGETESALFQMAAIVLGARGPETAEAAGHAGIAYGVAQRLGAFASERARGRTILPADLLARHGLSSAHIFAADPPEGLAPAVRELCEVANGHLRRAADEVKRLDPRLLPAFLPLAVVPLAIRRAERLGARIFAADVVVPDLRALLQIGAARVLGLR